ncbi:beta-ketoacyl synthase N-terminal-like domain-containing protein [Micromonospora echinospora]|uniref:beta-ketoacyl synthase N-terminal-like domain-containing protein n=1 Tax=Micromonospora echinospora TaxID=1877 RepID=UPI003435B8D3
MQGTPVHGRPIAVIGMAARFAGASDVESYWSNLINGVDSVSRTDEDRVGPQQRLAPDGLPKGPFVRAIAKVSDIDRFDADHFRVPPAEAITMDPQQRVLLEVATEALEDAGYAGERDRVVGVFVGCGENEYFREFVAPTAVHAGWAGDLRATLANEKDFLAPRLAFKLGLTGPAITVQTACSTSLSAVALACAALAAGDCDIALAGGVSLRMPDVHGYNYTEGGILSADGHCRPFDAEAGGTVPGSGAGIIVLRRDDDAQADRDKRRAVIRGWAVNNDGAARAGFTTPNVNGQEAVIRAALKRAGLTPDDIGYIEAHGTGTAIGDSVEFEALRRVFATDGRPPGSLTLGSVKANIGHPDAAAGVAGLIKAALAVEGGVVPGTAHFRTPNPELDITSTPFVVTAETRPWPRKGSRVAGVSSFGLGGSNAHVVLERAVAAPVAETTRPRQVLALSARSEDELNRVRQRLADRLEAMKSIDSAAMSDIAYTLAVGRTRFVRRWAAAVTDQADAVAQLRAPVDAGRRTARWSLAIAGTPVELTEMGARLQVTEPMFRPVLAELTGGVEFGGLAPQRAGALAALAAARMLLRLGLTFSRVEAPAWARPAADWLIAGADIASLPATLDACTDGTDPEPVRQGVGQVLIGPSFDVAGIVAAAWRAGSAVDWDAYYAEEPRGRVSLPPNPFTRQRFWLDRPEPTADRVDETPGASASATATSVLTFVQQVWCDVLGVESIAPDTHFMDLGGDSLYAVEVGARLSKGLGLDLPIDLPFIAPTAAATAAFIETISAREAGK